MATPTGLLAFGFGTGLSPKAPGTVGTLLGLLLAFPLMGVPLWAGALIVAVAFAAGIPICGRTARDLGVHDHGGIVFDEFVGLWLVLVCVPVHWAWWLAAFALFRLFDAAKPWPISWLDRRIHGGLGVMLDDLLAGVFCLAILVPVRLWMF